MHLSKLFLNSFYGASLSRRYQEYIDQVKISWPVMPPISSDEYYESMLYHLNRGYSDIPELSYTQQSYRSEFMHDCIGRYYGLSSDDLDELMDTNHSDFGWYSYPELTTDLNKIDLILEFVNDYIDPCIELVVEPLNT